MITVNLIRLESTNHGTPGLLICDEVGLNIRTIELPWKNNTVGLSCIPEGTYIVKPYKSPKFGNCWLVSNVPGRNYILFHRGNLAGDVTLGFKSHSRGCILPGAYVGKINNQLAVLNSTKAFSEMSTKIGLANSFKLKISKV